MKSKTLVFATLALSIHYAHALEITWADSAGNTNWNTGSSWVGGVSPNNSATLDVAIFTSVANAQPNLPTGTRSVNGIDFQLPAGGANFTSAAGALLRLGGTGIDATTQLSGTSTVSVESLQINGGSHEWTLFSNTSSSSTSTFTVSSNIDLNGNTLTVRSNRNTAGNNVGIVNLGGAISGSANLTLISPSAVRNAINLTGSSSYSGTTTITQVSVTANSLANAGNNSALGSSGDVILGTNAAVAYLTFQDLSVDGSTDRLLLFKGTTASNPFILANNDADNTVSFTNAGNTGDTVGSYANNLIFGLGGTNTGNNTFGQVINNRNGGGITSLRKEDPGTWVLTNSNTYTGQTDLRGGLLRIDNAAALGSGNLKLTGGGVLGLGASDLTTRIVGAGAGEVSWTGSGGFAAFGGDRTVSFGTPGTSINWTVTNFIGDGNTLILGHETADATLIWDQTLNLVGSTRTVQVNNGSAAIDAKISRSISGGSSPSVLNDFRKTGAGTLALTLNNFYWGETYVDAGTLMIGDGGSTGGVSRNSLDIIVASGATLAANRSNTLTQGTDDQLKVAISGDGGFAQLGSGNTVLTLSNVYTGPTTVAAGTLTVGASGVLPDTSAVSIGSAILDTANGVAEVTGTLAVTGAATINLGTGATFVFDDSNLEDWTGGTLNITGDFVAGSSIKFATSGGLDSGQLAVISVNGSGTGTYTLDASGFLVAGGGGSPYDTWATSKGLTGLPGSSSDPTKDADPDNDGRNNLAEFAFDGNPLSGSDNGKVFVLTEDSDVDGDASKELLLTIAVRTGTPVFAGTPSPSANFVADGITYSIEGSLDLASFPTTVNVVPTPVTTGLPAVGTGYEYRSFSLDGSNGLPGKGFLRAKVTSP